MGAFQSSACDGAMGGQLYACQSLINSPISAQIEWELVDSTMESLPPPPLHRRFLLAGRRLYHFFRAIRKPDTVGILIFTSAHFSFIEKGVMVIVAHLSNKFVVLSPRSGLILDDLQQSKFMRWYIPFVLRQCNIIMCQSKSWKHTYQAISHLPDSRFVVIPNWLDADSYRYLRDFKYKTNDKTVSYLFLGWLERYKGIYDLVHAVAQFKTELEGSRFIICGKGSEETAVKELVHKHNLDTIFEFRGWVFGKQKNQALAESDVFILPSHREGMPNALLEAMATGLAVVSTKVGGIPEVITHNDTGLLVDSGDIEQLGLSLVRLHYDSAKRTSLGKHAQAYILKQHDINNVWVNVHKIFTSINNGELN